MKSVYIKYKGRFCKLLFLISYFLFRRRRTMRKLGSYGFTGISGYQLRRWFRWHPWHGKIIRYYYMAELNGKKCFVKIVEAANDGTISNELAVNRYITQCGLDFVPELLAGDESYGKGEILLATGFKPGTVNFGLPADEESFEKVCGEFERIHGRFLDSGIIHGDISSSNLLLGPEDKILLIDFGIGRAPGSETHGINYQRHRGTYYRESGNTRTYDDAYSFLRMLEDCGIPDGLKQKDCYKRIEKLVGAHTYSVALPAAAKEGKEGKLE